jgi:hypothetical protein
MRLLHALIGALSFALVPVIFAGVADAATTAPFCLTFTTRTTAPNGQIKLQEAFANAAQFGDTISFFWDWGDEGGLVELTTGVMLAQSAGFKVVINLTNLPGKSIPSDYQPTDYQPAFADPGVAAAYIRDVAYLASLQPTYLNIYSEVNILAAYDPPEYANYQKIYANAYQAAKAASPTTLVGTSYVDVLWVGDHQEGLPHQLAPHDFIGITSYPFNQFPQVADIPNYWYSQWRAAYPDERLLFTEIAWGSAPPLSPIDQALFIAALPRLMQAVSPEVIAYAMQYDGSFGADPTPPYNQFNYLGLLTVYGQPKPAWYAAKILNFAVGR